MARPLETAAAGETQPGLRGMLFLAKLTFEVAMIEAQPAMGVHRRQN